MAMYLSSESPLVILLVGLVAGWLTGRIVSGPASASSVTWSDALARLHLGAGIISTIHQHQHRWRCSASHHQARPRRCPLDQWLWNWLEPSSAHTVTQGEGRLRRKVRGVWTELLGVGRYRGWQCRCPEPTFSCTCIGGDHDNHSDHRRAFLASRRRRLLRISPSLVMLECPGVSP